MIKTFDDLQLKMKQNDHNSAAIKILLQEYERAASVKERTRSRAWLYGSLMGLRAVDYITQEELEILYEKLTEIDQESIKKVYTAYHNLKGNDRATSCIINFWP